MPIDSLSALNAYRNQLKLMQGADGSDPQDGMNSAGGAGSTFAHMVEEAAKNAADTQYKAEGLETQSLTTGKVELSTLVTAIADAELTLNTVVAIRDRVINAYQDIIKMAI